MRRLSVGAMKRMFIFAIVVLTGLLIGVSAASALLSKAGHVGAVASGPWRTNPAVGAAAADPLTRARVARIGLLALTQSETVYYTAFTDSDGAPLTSACRYELSGGDLPTRWWSVTLYAQDNFLAQNGHGAHAVSADSVQRDAGGDYVTSLAEAQPGGAANWISTANAGAFSLTARLYNPDPAILSNLGDVALPDITRTECDAAGEAS